MKKFAATYAAFTELKDAVEQVCKKPAFNEDIIVNIAARNYTFPVREICFVQPSTLMFTELDKASPHTPLVLANEREFLASISVQQIKSARERVVTRFVG